ncbi:MAG TPA: hypothetical protein VGW77_24250 [Candidatus Binatia bacterium]|jgi:hypothetical protein|nr:hypothetical protein [Candidatus Binatia bacterium]
MDTKYTLSVRLIWIFIVMISYSESFAQSNPIFMQLGQAKAALYKPDSGPAPHVGIVVMHRESNYMNNIACREFSRRGFMVLCMNSRFENNESLVDWELIPLDVAQGVNHLKNVQHMNKVILYGNSGGGVTMSFYQAVAENGPSVCQGSNKLVQCGSNVAGLTRADGIILSDGHPGNPILRLRSINPAVNNESHSDHLILPLNPFDPANGYNANGASSYSDTFKEKYFKAQAERMNRLIDSALELLQRIEEGNYVYTDDAPFNIGRFDGARLLSLDPSIRHTTIQPEKLLKNDGSIAIQIIESIAPSRPELREANQTFSEGSRDGLTVRSFLSSNAIRATNSMDEKQIDLCSSNNSTPCMLQNVTVPLLAAANQASFQNLIQEVEINYLYAKSSDKDFIVVEGATTGVTPCTNCPLPASAYSNVTKNFFDYAAKWINDRF